MLRNICNISKICIKRKCNVKNSIGVFKFLRISLLQIEKLTELKKKKEMLKCIINCNWNTVALCLTLERVLTEIANN